MARIVMFLLVITLITAPFVSAGQRRLPQKTQLERTQQYNPEGQPRDMREGNPNGYYVWVDNSGWHVRTTTNRDRRRFHGEIVAADRNISDVRAISRERRDWVNLARDGKRITFDLTTSEGIDGFDFRCDALNINFNLLIDGRERPGQIQIGSAGVSPNANPFTLGRTNLALPPATPAAPIMAVGKPEGMGEGSTHRYIIWRDNDGTWHLRTTTARKQHRFHGEIEAQGGTISGLRAISAERKDWVGFGGQNKITFDLNTEGAIDGFDFRTNGTNLIFRLNENGQPKPQNVYIGARATNPTAIPFTLPAK